MAFITLGYLLLIKCQEFIKYKDWMGSGWQGETPPQEEVKRLNLGSTAGSSAADSEYRLQRDGASLGVTLQEG